jgi:hypothetical protein
VAALIRRLLAIVEGVLMASDEILLFSQRTIEAGLLTVSESWTVNTISY